MASSPSDPVGAPPRDLSALASFGKETNQSIMAGDTQIGEVLAQLRSGDKEAMDRLFPLVYDELHQLARRHVRKMGAGQTLDTTALLHEAYLKLRDKTRSELANRAHFMAVASTIMRHLLIDHARARSASKRGGDLERATLEGLADEAPTEPEDLLALDKALKKLAELDERLVSLVEMRFFGGLTGAEIGEVLELSERTVKREWRKAKALLLHLLSPEPTN